MHKIISAKKEYRFFIVCILLTFISILIQPKNITVSATNFSEEIHNNILLKENFENDNDKSLLTK